MDIKLTILTGTLVFNIVACDTGSQNKGTISNANCVKIEIAGDIDRLLQIDSIFSGFKAIPLETKKECLIGKIIKTKIYKGKMFILDELKSLFVFNTNGKFLYEIGKRGKGPGEYLELRDFDIDSNGNVYILDFRRILMYKNDGTFLKKFIFDFLPPKSKIRCNPLEFAVKDDGNFYIWGGTFELKNNPDGNYYSIYEMTEKGKITNKYFPLKHAESQGFQNHRFVPYKDLTLIDPSFGSNIIYSIDKDGIVDERWFIDFGKKTLNIPIPQVFSSLGVFKAEIDGLYYNSINGFNETKEWISFRFTYKRKIYNVYHSKNLKKTFISPSYPSVSGRIAPRIIFDSYNDDFITFLEPDFVIKSIYSCKDKDFKGLSVSEKDIIEQFKQIKISDNPILFICSLKNY